MKEDETKIVASTDAPVDTDAPVETPPSLEEKFMNIIAELEARIEKLEADAVKLKSGMPQIAF